MNDLFRNSALPVILLALAGCATQGKPPPSISLDEPVLAQPLPEAPKPVEVVSVPEPLALPGQLMPLPGTGDAKLAQEPADEKVRVSRANAEARIAPTREGYVNAIQVWPFTDGALYQVYAAVGRVTVIALQPGEELVTVAAGDTVRWIAPNAGTRWFPPCCKPRVPNSVCARTPWASTSMACRGAANWILPKEPSHE